MLGHDAGMPRDLPSNVAVFGSGATGLTFIDTSKTGQHQPGWRVLSISGTLPQGHGTVNHGSGRKRGIGRVESRGRSLIFACRLIEPAETEERGLLRAGQKKAS
jgi:hypothetical protein